MPLRSLVAVGLVLGAIAAGAVVAAREGASSTGPSDAPASGWRGLVDGSRTQVAIGQRMIVLLRAPSLADRVRAAGGVATDTQERRWTVAVVEEQQQLLTRFALRGLTIRPAARFTHVVNGFSVALDTSTAAALERDESVRGVYGVRAVFPASYPGVRLRPSQLRGGLSRMPPSLAGFAGSGVTIALLDTGVDPRTPFLHGHVLPGIDVVSRGPDARPRARPGSPATLERHGTEMAGILVGSTGGSPSGVAPDATVLPIRVAGWQRDTIGRWSLHGRTDQILAGLERAVDPDGNGDAHDGARIAVLPLVEPFGAFDDGPLARAAAGALDLDMLLVTAAGNDGPAGPAFGSVSGPGGAAGAVAVGAADLRSRTSSAVLVVRSGLRVLLRRTVPVLGAAGPSQSRNLPLISLHAVRPLRKLFDAHGVSIVAGRAVLVPAGTSPREEASRLSRAGAALVLLAGAGLPPGGLGLDESAGTPVLAVPGSLARLLDQTTSMAGASVSVGRATVGRNDRGLRIASFSSRGLAFGGQLKPDLSGPGVGVVTANPGANEDGTSRFVTVSGSSAAAAAVAGEAALLTQARPALNARGLGGILVGTARPLENEPAEAQGAGLVDLGAAATAEVVAEPATISFGRGGTDGWGRREIRVRNLSTRRLTIYVGTGPRSRGPVVVRAAPRKLVLPRGAAALVRLRVRALRAEVGAASGSLTLAPVGSEPVHVPWAVVLAPVSPTLLGRLELSKSRFEPSDASPAVLALRVGRIDAVAGRTEVEPVLRLDVELRSARGKPIGLLARLRNVLPGRYAYGLTGRGPNGRVLKRGTYRLRVVAWPAAGGQAIRRSVRFTIE